MSNPGELAVAAPSDAFKSAAEQTASNTVQVNLNVGAPQMQPQANVSEGPKEIQCHVVPLDHQVDVTHDNLATTAAPSEQSLLGELCGSVMDEMKQTVEAFGPNLPQAQPDVQPAAAPQPVPAQQIAENTQYTREAQNNFTPPSGMSGGVG